MKFDLQQLRNRIDKQKGELEFYQTAIQMLIHKYDIDQLNSKEDFTERYSEMPESILEDIANGFIPDIETLMLSDIHTLDNFVFDQMKLLGLSYGVEELQEAIKTAEDDGAEKYLEWLMSLMGDEEHEGLLCAFSALLFVC